VSSRIVAPDFPFSRSLSESPKPNGTNSDMFKKATRGPVLFPPLTRRNGDPFNAGFACKENRKGYSVRKRMPVTASARIRFDQLEAVFSSWDLDA
jgi:hypothetical protein